MQRSDKRAVGRAERGVIIIPARYASARFPGKALAPLGGTPLVEWVYRHGCAAAADVYVATDDARIAAAVESAGGSVLRSDKPYRNGSERVFDAFLSLLRAGHEYDYLVNLQVDEPLLPSADIRRVIDALADTAAPIATLAAPLRSAADDADTVKVVRASDGRALYFSRAAIPFHTAAAASAAALYWKHIGVYVFRRAVVAALASLPCTPLEQAEDLEQLRWLEAGYSIHVETTETEDIDINTAAALARAEALLKERL